MSAILLETEKSFQVQEKNFFTIVFSDLSFKINKIELAKLIKQVGLDVVKINASQPYFKKKKRNGLNKKPVTVMVKRPRKFMIKLKVGQILSKEHIETINSKLSTKNVKKVNQEIKSQDIAQLDSSTKNLKQENKAQQKVTTKVYKPSV